MRARDPSPGAREGGGLDRRRFLQGASGVVVSAALGAQPAAAAGARAARGRRGGAPAYLRRSSYERLDRRSFQAGAGRTAKLRLELVEVADLPVAGVERRLRGHEDAFRLTFSGPWWMPLEQGTRALRHPGLGSFELFLVPAGGDGWTRYYEAIVHRGAPRARRRDDDPPRRGDERRARERRSRKRRRRARSAPGERRLRRREALGGGGREGAPERRERSAPPRRAPAREPLPEGPSGKAAPPAGAPGAPPG